MLKTYYSLTKPGIIRGNAITAIAGFFLAAQGVINLWLFLAMLVGVSLVIGSGCVFNNYIDQDIDSVMTRTKQRALVIGQVSNQAALIYGTILVFIGAGLLAAYINLLTTAVALFGFFAYVFLYGYTKRRTVHGTVIGSIAGAVPPVVGYTAVTNQIDTAALILFLILIFWQMPHFYAIAIYRQSDYAAAKIPVLPIVKGIETTKRYILAYIIAFTLAAASLTFLGYTSYVYLAITLFLGGTWFRFGITKPNTINDQQWARGMFRFSLIVITVLCITISADMFLR